MTTETLRCHCGSSKSPFGPQQFTCDTCEMTTDTCECKLGATDEAKKKAAGLK